jgi:hypothetical protein
MESGTNCAGTDFCSAFRLCCLLGVFPGLMFIPAASESLQSNLAGWAGALSAAPDEIHGAKILGIKFMG